MLKLLQLYKKEIAWGRLKNPACVSSAHLFKSQSTPTRSLFCKVVVDVSSQYEPTIAAIEQSQFLSAKNTWSFYQQKPVSQSSWESMVEAAVEPIAEDNSIGPYQ